MAYSAQGSRRDRLGSAAAVVAVHALVGYAFLTGLSFSIHQDWAEPLKVFDVSLPGPPPPEPAPAPSSAEAKAPEAPAPPNLRARPKPIVAPEPPIPLPKPPILAAPVAGEGGAPASGASDRPGPGTGAGGEGTGTGAGGIAVRSRHISGRIADRDYPPAARRALPVGSVVVRFTVQPSGRVTGCAPVRASGSAEADAHICRLIERRFRYRPARNAAGDPVAEVRMWEQRWWLDS